MEEEALEAALYGKPEISFRSCIGVLRLAGRYDRERFNAACRYALELGSTTYRRLDAILRTGVDPADAEPASAWSGAGSSGRRHRAVRCRSARRSSAMRPLF